MSVIDAASDHGSLTDAGSSGVRAEDREGSGAHRFNGAVASCCVLGTHAAGVLLTVVASQEPPLTATASVCQDRTVTYPALVLLS